jgi:gamma-glutamylcyclotransferase (GGCT)/AIG2-like uncharacterized protein YtfP
MYKLFSYGSLQQNEIQEDVFGRTLKGTPEKLIGYALKKIQIEEEFGLVNYPVIIETKNDLDSIEGFVYDLSENELTQADLYEGMHYKRVEVLLHSNQKAWAYSAANLTHF